MTTTPETNEAAAALATAFVPGDVEGRLYEKWVDAGYFNASAQSDREPFCIVIPPPNVTGSLHIGHALDHTLQDTLIRRRRMQGYEALWLPGMDHAGIATQNVVERQLAAEKTSRHDLGREAFVQKVWQWKTESGGAILGQMRRLGDSVDWSRERFTMDEGLSKAVLTIFKRLYEADLIYRAERIINWCPRCLTALSDIEVEHSDDDGELVSIRYGEGAESIVVATTRAETMLGDTAIAVHPEDERYAHLVGRTILMPITGRSIPVVADEHVDPEFGTGAVKVTPAHDPNDFDISQRHGIESLTILDAAGIVTNSGTEFDGLDRFAARTAVVERLREEGRIVAEKRPYVHSVGHCQRCDTTVEPRLSLQWFVRVAPLAKAAADAVRDGRVKIEPATLAPRYFDWVDNMHDWCISRQLWWGHRIPVWYGPDGEVRVLGPDEEAPQGWTQDEDVLDTWFSSALWPFSTLGWPDQADDLRKFYPTSVLVTGYDILFFWVARMMMFGLFAMDGTPPFNVIALHGLVRDRHGKKMSKSRGNTIDPLEWMDRYGADALRFALARGANPGSDQALAEEWVAGARNFATKLWNATRFALMNEAKPGELPAASELAEPERWILSRLAHTTEEVNDFLERFEYSKACEALYHFAWDDLCDWYLEMAKAPFAQGGVPAEQARVVLGSVLEQVLRLLHPIMPFVTEELWTALTGGESVMIAPWPTSDRARIDDDAEALMARIVTVVGEVRRFRTDQGLKPAQRVPAVIEGIAQSPLAPFEGIIRSLTRLSLPEDGFTEAAALPIDGLKVSLDLAGTIDIAAERNRLTRDLAAAEKEREQALVKLENDEFMAKAPDAIKTKIKDRLSSADADIARLSAQLSAMPPA
jgi:valyl-tRNA synthetase